MSIAIIVDILEAEDVLGVRYERVKRRIEILKSKLEMTNDQDEYEQIQKEKEIF